MNAILFVIDRPPEPTSGADERQADERQTVLRNLKNIWPTNTEGEVLAANCWLLQMPDGVRCLGYAIAECDKVRIPYRLLILQDEDLNWIVPTSRS